MNTTALRFGALYHLNVTPREQALADPGKVARSGKVNTAVITAEREAGGKLVNQSTVLVEDQFYSIAGESRREAEKLEDRYFEALPKLDRFVLDRADSKEEAAELLGQERVDQIESELANLLKNWISEKTAQGEVKQLNIDLTA